MLGKDGTGSIDCPAKKNRQQSEIGKRTGSHEYFSWFIFNSALNKWNVVVVCFNKKAFRKFRISLLITLFKVWPPPMITHLIENQLIEGEQILGACPSLQRIRQGNDPLPSFQYLSFRTTHGPRHYLFAQTICPPVLLGKLNNGHTGNVRDPESVQQVFALNHFLLQRHNNQCQYFQQQG